MCLDLKKSSKKKFAFRNIVVYKQLGVYVDSTGIKRYVTPYQYHKVVIGNTYKSELKRYGLRIREGLHSFKKLEDCISNTSRHFMVFREDKFKPNVKPVPVYVKCVIPFGSWYYEGTFDSDYESLASNRLKIVEIIDIDKK